MASKGLGGVSFETKALSIYFFLINLSLSSTEAPGPIRSFGVRFFSRISFVGSFPNSFNRAKEIGLRKSSPVDLTTERVEGNAL